MSDGPLQEWLRAVDRTSTAYLWAPGRWNGSTSTLAKLGLERRTRAAVPATRLLGEHPH